MELTTVCAGRLGVGIVVVGVDTGGGGTVTDCAIGTPTGSAKANFTLFFSTYKQHLCQSDIFLTGSDDTIHMNRLTSNLF